MARSLRDFLLWIFGLAAFLALAAYVGWSNLGEFAAGLKAVHVLGWLLLTLLARLLSALVLTLPVEALGGTVRLSDSFWASWIRSFFNQVVPLSGTAYMARFVRSRAMLSWSQIAALGSPQLLFLGLATGIVGLVLVNLASIPTPDMSLALTAAFSVLAAGAGTVIAFGRFQGLFKPRRFGRHVANVLGALAQLHSRFSLIAWLVLLHAATVLLRGLRLGVLFHAVSAQTDLATVLLLSCAGEISIVLQITPGGVGVREGTLAGAAVLLGVDPQLMAAVAVLDRALIFLALGLITPVAFWKTRSA